jgi:uracil-DNA glycosylase
LLGQLTDVKEFVAKAAKKKSKAVEVPRFSLSLWQLEDQLLVVDSRQPQQALPTENLLQNILLALGYAQQPLPQAHVVRWPIIENRFEAQGVSEARETLAALLTARLEIQPAKYVLLMGAEACHYLLPAEQLAETQDESLINLQGKALTVNHIIEGQTMIVTPSLTDMLRDTSLKAITWQAIQPLRR